MSAGPPAVSLGSGVFTLNVADPPPKGVCYVSGRTQGLLRMFALCTLWVTFYVAGTIFIASKLPEWLA